MRFGFGCDAVGGNGTGIITITALGPDTVPATTGTLRWAFNQIDSTNRRVVIDPSLSGTIPIDTPLYWTKPFSTLDLSAADVRIKTTVKSKNAIVFTATNNIIVYGVRCEGYFQGGGPNWKFFNNAGCLALDGDGGTGGQPYAWDTEWAGTPPQLRRGVRDSIFDRNTVSSCEDDALNTWEAVRQVSFTRNFVHDCYHPSTSGAKGSPLPLYRERLWVTHAYNVYARNGERNVALPRRETYWLDAWNNILFEWSEYCGLVFDGTAWVYECNTPQGISIETDAPIENDRIWVRGNCFIGKTSGKGAKWGCGAAQCGLCDVPQNCCAPNCGLFSGRNFACCNPGMQANHWDLSGNYGDVAECVATNPAGWVSPSLPYTSTVIAFPDVLTQVGVPLRNDGEQNLINLIQAKLVAGKCDDIVEP